MITPAPERRPGLRLPRTLPRERPLATPVSEARWGFFRSSAFFFRIGALGAVSFGLFAILGLRIWSLQVIQGPEYEQLARRQTFRTVDLPSPRAPILDAKGRVLVESDGRLALTMDALSFGNVSRNGRWWQPTPRGRRALRRVSRLVGVPTRTLVRNARRSVVRSPYAPAVVVRRLSQPLAFYLEERRDRLPGFRVTAFPDRQYPQGALGSEFLGLLGQIDDKQLKRHRYSNYKPGEVIGQSGVEATYDRLLNGGFSRARVPVDAVGQPTGQAVPVRAARATHALRLTINAGLQRSVEQAIQNGIRYAHTAGNTQANAGAAVVMNARTGAVYAIAGYPSFNQVAAARDPRYLEKLLRGQGASLLNLPTQGVFPLGSTFKPIVAQAALAAGLISPWSTLPCTGSLTVGNHVFHNVEPGVNASLNLPQALSTSCDTWFYRLGVMFDQRRVANGSLDMQRWARLLGLGHPTGFDVPGEASGVIPTPAWLRKTATEPWQRVWFTGYSVNLSIGQGQLAVTPLQLAVAYAAIANGGTVVRPHVADALLSSSGEVSRRLRFKPVRRLDLPNAWAIRQGLYDAAHQGTSASIFADFPVPIAGKTGTAETGTGTDHSWYASWAPAGNPKIVVVVLIENGGFGAEAAAPAARDIYRAYFGLKAERTATTR
jgi:penicillin-binding protein 2